MKNENILKEVRKREETIKKGKQESKALLGYKEKLKK